MGLLPKETKTEVLTRKFGEVYKNVEAVKRFHRCNENEYMRNQVNNNVCPVCNREIKDDDEKQLHHTTYDRQCIYNSANRCELCAKNHPEEFERCKALLIYLHKECHYSIHGYDSDKINN